MSGEEKPFVPSYGPPLPGATAGLSGERSTTNAAPVSPNPGPTAIFAAGELVSVRTTVVNERIRVTLCVDRSNNNAAGQASYQLLIDGVATGPIAGGPVGTAQQRLVVIDGEIAIAAPGAHTVGAQATSLVGVETVAAGSNMLVNAQEFA